MNLITQNWCSNRGKFVKTSFLITKRVCEYLSRFFGDIPLGCMNKRFIVDHIYHVQYRRVSVTGAITEPYWFIGIYRGRVKEGIYSFDCMVVDMELPLLINDGHIEIDRAFFSSIDLNQPLLEGVEKVRELSVEDLLLYVGNRTYPLLERVFRGTTKFLPEEEDVLPDKGG